MKKWSEFKTLLYKKDVNKKHLFEVLKKDFSFIEQRKILSKVPKTFYSILHGNIFPKEYAEIGSQKRGDGYDLITELNWYVNQATQFPKKIEEFINLKSSFEKNILIGSYEKSESILHEIEDEVCKSYWGMESQFIQTQLEKGYEANVEWNNIIQENKSDDPAYYFLSAYFHYKVEDDVTLLSFQKELKSLQNQLEKENDFREYFSYRLDFFYYKFENFERTFWVAKNQSIIDKYLLIRDFLVQNASNGLYLEYIELLSNNIKDPLLLKLQQNNQIHIDFNANQLILIEIEDLYIRGKYELAIELINDYVFENPNNASISITYIKCLHCLKLDFCLPDKLKDTLLGNILKQLYLFLERTDRSNVAVLELLNIINRIQSFDFAKQIVSFLEDYYDKNISNSKNKYSFYYSKEYKTSDYKSFTLKSKKIDFLNYFNNSIKSKLLRNILDGNIDSEEINIIPKSRIENYNALWLYEMENYEIAETTLLSALHLNEEINFIKENILQTLFKCHFKMNMHDDAINLFIEYYFKNENLYNGLNIEDSALKIAKQDRFKSVNTSNINVSIFISLSDIRTSNIYVAYNLYLKSLGIKKPSEIETYLNSIPKVKIIFFLKQVCSTKVLSRAVMVFKTSIQVLEERLSINQLLISIDEENQDIYSKEITQLTRDLNVQKRKKEIDQSKIYVDEFGLINAEFDNIRKGFDRYRKISELLKESSFQGVGFETSSLLQLILGKIDSKTYQKALKNTDYQFNMFQQLYLEIRDKFLFSDKFGLDYYLSTRLRHGTIEGQLRRSFNNTRLVTSRNKELGDYINDTFWTKKINFKKDIEKLFQLKIKTFSKNIDGIISNLKNELIQIRTEDPSTSDKGLFDFIQFTSNQFERKTYIEKFRDITNFDDLVSAILEVLWDKTEFNLKYIRRCINIDIRNLILKEIDSFEAEIKELLINYDCNELSSHIIQCRTNIQKDIDKVVLWFRRSKSFEVDFKMQDVVASSIDTVTNIDPDIKLELKENIIFDELIKGRYFIHFDDLLKIFFNNIADYIKSSKTEILLSEIEIKRIDKALVIEITNDLKEKEDLDKFTALLEDKFKKIQSTVGLRSENDSGLKKALNIVINVFRNPSNNITVRVVERRVKFRCIISIDELLVK